MVNVTQAAAETGGPYFDARWRHKGVWTTEQYRLFRNAKARIEEEQKAGAEMGYVNHLPTDEPVYSVGVHVLCGPPTGNIIPQSSSNTSAVPPLWPDVKLEEEMLRDAQRCEPSDMSCHVQALLQRVRELERALIATGYFRNLELPGIKSEPSDFDRWKDNVEYTEAIDASLDGVVPSRGATGPIYLAERVKMLVDVAKRRSKLAYELFRELDKVQPADTNADYLKLKPLLDQARKEFEVTT